MKAYKYDEKKLFESEIDCQIDPLESKEKGYDVYLLPANATFKEPLPEKDGFYVVFNGKDWEYQEKPKPTHNEIIMKQIYVLKGKLSETDYKAIKFAEGWISEADYSETKAQREQWRVEIRELEKEIEPTDENSTADGN